MDRYMKNTNITHKRTYHPQVRFAAPEGDVIMSSIEDRWGVFKVLLF